MADKMKPILLRNPQNVSSYKNTSKSKPVSKYCHWDNKVNLHFNFTASHVPPTPRLYLSRIRVTWNNKLHSASAFIINFSNKTADEQKLSVCEIRANL